MAITWAMIVEQIIKWLIPAICVAIVGAITVRIVNPIKKGTSAQKQEEWDQLMRNSTLPPAYCEQTYNKLREESDNKDHEILDKIDMLCGTINEHNMETKAYRQMTDANIEAVKEGVRDVHLQNLIHTCEKYIKRGYITSAEREIYNQRYALYKSLGGNGHMEPWDAKIAALPSEPQHSSSYIAHTTQTPPTTHL